MNNTPPSQPATPSDLDVLRSTVAELIRAVEDMGVHVKYAAFDLAATRRERDHAAGAAAELERESERLLLMIEGMKSKLFSSCQRLTEYELVNSKLLDENVRLTKLLAQRGGAT
jgi:hypothetical protein